MADISLINPDPTMGPPGITFNEAAGIRVSRFDPGYPEIRTVEDYRPHQHGSVSFTKYFGPREISIEFMIIPQLAGMSMIYIENTIRALCNPLLRPFLVEHLDQEQAPRRISVVSASLHMPYHAYNRKECQISFRCPEGYWEADFGRQYDLNPIELGGGGGGISGRAYNLTFPRTYPAGQAPTGGTIVVNNGTLATYPVARVHGPYTEFVLRNVTQDKHIKIEGVTIATGNFIEIDFRNRTVLLNGDINGSYYNYVDWEESEWWDIGLGETLLSFLPIGYTTGITKATISYRDNFL